MTFLTVNASVAPTREEAERLLLPNLIMMSWLRTGKPIRPIYLVEDAEALALSAAERATVEAPRAAATWTTSVAANTSTQAASWSRSCAMVAEKTLTPLN